MAKTCVCSGIRSCLICESVKRQEIKVKNQNKYFDYNYCRICGDKAFVPEFSDHHCHQQLESLIKDKDYLVIDGVFVGTDVIDANEELEIVRKVDSFKWIDSQSGRRKQDFGPKVNFKKQKVNSKQFNGLPDFDRQLFNRFVEELDDRKLLKDFIVVEVCHLEYTPENGSAIDPHFDDFWLWGPRLVTINLLSSTVLNLILPEEQESVSRLQKVNRIRVPLPQRSIVILSAESRYKYHHSIDRQDINSRRLAITYRELTDDFLPNGQLYDKWGKDIIKRSFNTIESIE